MRKAIVDIQAMQAKEAMDARLQYAMAMLDIQVKQAKDAMEAKVQDAKAIVDSKATQAKAAIDTAIEAESGTLYKKRIACNKQHSPLLRLPAELRNKIYKHVLEGHEIHARVQNAPFTARKIWREQHGLCKAIRALPRASHQLRHETSLLVYKYNTFRVRTYDLDAFFDAIGESAARALRHLVIEHRSVLLGASYRRLYDLYRHGNLARIEVQIREGRDGGYLAEVKERLERGFAGTGCVRGIEVVVGEGEMVIY